MKTTLNAEEQQYPLNVLKIKYPEIYCRCSPYLIEQLLSGYKDGTIQFENVIAAITQADCQFTDGCSSASGMKSATEFKNPQLQRLWHQHYHTGSSIEAAMRKSVSYQMKNRRPNSDADVSGIIRKAITALPKDYSKGTATGDWLLFKPVESKNYYLTLWQHSDANEDDELVAHLQRHRLFDYPEALR